MALTRDDYRRRIVAAMEAGAACWVDLVGMLKYGDAAAAPVSPDDWNAGDCMAAVKSLEDDEVIESSPWRPGSMLRAYRIKGSHRAARRLTQRTT